MKTTLLFLVFNFIFILAFSQDHTMKYDSIHNLYLKVDGNDTMYFEPPSLNSVVIDRMPPVFIGNMEMFIKENLIYPEEAKKKKLEGYVKIYCPIDSNGVPLKILVLYSTSPLFEKEAERIVRLMRWKWDKKEPFKESWSEQIRIDFKL